LLHIPPGWFSARERGEAAMPGAVGAALTQGMCQALLSETNQEVALKDGAASEAETSLADDSM
jgi:hypothetical protein